MIKQFPQLLNNKLRPVGLKHADFPRQGKSAPTHPSLFSPTERNHARSVFEGFSHPLAFTKEKHFASRGKISVFLKYLA